MWMLWRLSLRLFPSDDEPNFWPMHEAADKEGASSCAIVCGVGFATGNKGNLFAGSTRCVRVFIIFSIAIGTCFFFCGWTTRTYGSVAHHGNVTLLGWHLRVRLTRSLTVGGCNRFFANKNSADVIPD